MPKQTPLLSSAGLFPFLLASRREEMTGLTAARRAPALRAACSVPQRFSFPHLPPANICKLERANAGCSRWWQQRLCKRMVEAIWKLVDAKACALSRFARDAAGEFGSRGKLPFLLPSSSGRCHCHVAVRQDKCQTHSSTRGSPSSGF